MDNYFFENVLIKLMFTNKDISDKIYPYLDVYLFDKNENKEIIKQIKSYVEKYESFPKINELLLTLKESEHNYLVYTVMVINTNEYDNTFLLDNIEKYIRKKMITNVCCDIAINIDNDEYENVITNTPDLLRTAVTFSFNNEIGLDLFSSENELYNQFHKKQYVVPTNITYLNSELGGGFNNKSLTLFLAETNRGKSLVMSSLAVSNVLHNNNVLYVSCELSEFKTAERMLANIFDIPIRDLKLLQEDKFKSKFKMLRDSVFGKIIIKEYPSKSISSNDIRTLLKELEMKKKFIPDIIYIDQIENLNSSHRSKLDNTYTEMKRVTQEIRGLSIERDIPIVSAIQTNRDGIGSSELDLTSVGDSLGFAQIADVVIAITQTEEMVVLNKFILNLIKTRFSDIKAKFTVKVNKTKMQIMDDTDVDAIKYLSDNVSNFNIKKNNAISMVNNIITIENRTEEKKIIDWE